MLRQNQQEILSDFSRKMGDIIFSKARVIEPNVTTLEIRERTIHVAQLEDKFLGALEEGGRKNVVQMAVESIIADPEYSAVFSQKENAHDILNSESAETLKKQERNLAIAMILPVECQIFYSLRTKECNWFILLHDLARQYYEYVGIINVRDVSWGDGFSEVLSRTLQKVGHKVVEALDKNTDLLFHCSDITLRDLSMLLQAPLFNAVGEAASRVQSAMPNYRPLDEQLGSIEARIQEIQEEYDWEKRYALQTDLIRSVLFRRSDFTKLINDISIAYRHLLLQVEESNLDPDSLGFEYALERIQAASENVRKFYSMFGLFGVAFEQGRCQQQLFLEFSLKLIKSAHQDVNLKSLFIADPHAGWDDIVDDQGFLARLDAFRQLEKDRVAEISEMLNQGLTLTPQLKADLLALHHYTALALEELYPYTIDFQSTSNNPLDIGDRAVCANHTVSKENREIARKAFSSLETCLARSSYLFLNPDEIFDTEIRNFNELNQIIPDKNQDWGRYEAEAPQREAEAAARHRAAVLAEANSDKERSAAAMETLRRLKEEGKRLEAEADDMSFGAKFNKLMRAIARPLVWLFTALSNLVKRLFGSSDAESELKNRAEGLDAPVELGFSDKKKQVKDPSVVTPNADAQLGSASEKLSQVLVEKLDNQAEPTRVAPGPGKPE